MFLIGALLVRRQLAQSVHQSGCQIVSVQAQQCADDGADDSDTVFTVIPKFRFFDHFVVECRVVANQTKVALDPALYSAHEAALVDAEDKDAVALDAAHARIVDHEVAAL